MRDNLTGRIGLQLTTHGLGLTGVDGLNSEQRVDKESIPLRRGDTTR